MTLRLDILITLLEPLSHISRSDGNWAHFVKIPVMQDNGSMERVPVYSGNALRGQLRDAGASYMLDHLGVDSAPAMVGLDPFALLFFGGRIGGETRTDIHARKAIRNAVPHVAMLGGGIGNQIMDGLIDVDISYPVCREVARLLPPELHE